MYLVYIHWAAVSICFHTFLHPCLILPVKLVDICHNRSVIRTHLERIAIWIRFQDQISCCRHDLIFINFTSSNMWKEQFKNAHVFAAAHCIHTSVPHIHISNYADTFRMRSPDRKVGSLHTINLHRMCAKLLINLVMDPISKHIAIIRSKIRRETIWIFRCHESTILKIFCNLIWFIFLCLKVVGEDSHFMHTLHPMCFLFSLKVNTHPARTRMVGGHNVSSLYLMWSEHTLWVWFITTHNPIQNIIVDKLLYMLLHNKTHPFLS